MSCFGVAKELHAKELHAKELHAIKDFIDMLLILLLGGVQGDGGHEGGYREGRDLPAP